MSQRKHPNQTSHRSPPPVRPEKSVHGSMGGRRRPKARADEDGLWLYGMHAVVAALGNPHRKKMRFLATANALETLSAHIKAPEPAAEIVDSQQIARLLPPGAVHQGLALRVQSLPEPDLKDACATGNEGKPRLVVVLDQLTDPQNVGAILRSCVAFGASAVILTGHHAPPATGALAKAASGALDMIPIVRVINLARAMEQLAELGYWRVGLDSEAPQLIADIDLTGNVAIVLGAEGGGLRPLTARKCDFLARIPASGPIASLNVSNAAAIILYEAARRQTGGQNK